MYIIKRSENYRCTNIIIFIVMVLFFPTKDGFAQQYKYIDVGKDAVIIDSIFQLTTYNHYKYNCYMANSLNHLYDEYDYHGSEVWRSNYFEYDLYDDFSDDFRENIKYINCKIVEYLSSFNMDISYIKKQKFILVIYPNSKGEILHSRMWSNISLLEKMSPQDIEKFFTFIKTLKIRPSKRATEKLYTIKYLFIWRCD